MEPGFQGSGAAQLHSCSSAAASWSAGVLQGEEAPTTCLPVAGSGSGRRHLSPGAQGWGRALTHGWGPVALLCCSTPRPSSNAWPAAGQPCRSWRWPGPCPGHSSVTARGGSKASLGPLACVSTPFPNTNPSAVSGTLISLAVRLGFQMQMCPRLVFVSYLARAQEHTCQVRPLTLHLCVILHVPHQRRALPAWSRSRIILQGMYDKYSRPF